MQCSGLASPAVCRALHRIRCTWDCSHRRSRPPYIYNLALSRFGTEVENLGGKGGPLRPQHPREREGGFAPSCFPCVLGRRVAAWTPQRNQFPARLTHRVVCPLICRRHGAEATDATGVATGVAEDGIVYRGAVISRRLYVCSQQTPKTLVPRIN